MKQIFCDLDGVVADFVGGALRAHGKSLHWGDVCWDFWTKIGFEPGNDPRFWEPLNNAEFWANLDPLPDGMGLFRCIEETYGAGKIGVMSSAMCRGGPDGKKDWLIKHLPGYEKRANFCTVKEMSAAPCKILIDDYDQNVNAFREARGHAILVPRPWNSRKSEVLPGGFFDTAKILDEVHTAMKA